MIPSNLHTFFNLFVAFIVLDTLAVFLRVWSRIVASGVSFSYDDITTLIAWPSTITTFALILALIPFGLGTPIATVSSSDLSRLLENLYFATIFFNVAITLPKLSALLFYRRLFGLRKGVNNAFRICWWVLFSLTIAWFLAFEILDIAQCIPVAHYWDSMVHSHCTKGTLASMLPATISSVIIDIAILTLPIPVLWSLNMSRNKKAITLVIILLGYGVVVGSVGRMIANIVLVPQLEADPTLSAYKSLYWVAFEPGFSLIAINIPSTFQLIKRSYDFGLGSLFSSRDYSQIPLRDFDTRNAGSGSTHRLQTNPSSAAGSNANITTAYALPTKDMPQIPAHGDAPLYAVYVRRDIDVTGV